MVAIRGSTTVTARRLREDRSGAALVEFALVAPVFFALLIALMQLAVLGMMSANFNGAMESVSRRIRTGQADRPASVEAFRNLICSRMVDTSSNCQARIQVTVRPVNGNFAGARAMIQAQDVTKISGNEPYATGEAEQVMVVTATYKWPVVLPFVGNAYIRDGSWDVLMVSRLAFRNEPWE